MLCGVGCCAPAAHPGRRREARSCSRHSTKTPSQVTRNPVTGLMKGTEGKRTEGFGGEHPAAPVSLSVSQRRRSNRSRPIKPSGPLIASSHQSPETSRSEPQHFSVNHCANCLHKGSSQGLKNFSFARLPSSPGVFNGMARLLAAVRGSRSSHSKVVLLLGRLRSNFILFDSDGTSEGRCLSSITIAFFFFREEESRCGIAGQIA